MPLPPHRALNLEGLHAYSDRESVCAGETIRFHTSSREAYELEIYRLGLDVDGTAGDSLVASVPREAPRAQPIHPGSYIDAAGLANGEEKLALSLECWVRTSAVFDWTGLLTQHDYPASCSFGLFISDTRAVHLYLGDGWSWQNECDFQTAAGVIQDGIWYHIVGTWDGKRAAIYLDGVRVVWADFEGTVAGGPSRLRIGAYGNHGVTNQFLNGDIAMPAVYEVALTMAEVKQRYADKARQVPTSAALLGCWPLSEEKGSRVGDRSLYGRHGTIINGGTWMVGGPEFDPNFGAFDEYDPTLDPKRGHALRLASDDLYDCGWDATESYTLPPLAQPGLYVARYKPLAGGEPLYQVTFVVRRKRDAPRATVTVLANTNTWRAYNLYPFGENYERDVPKYGFYHLAHAEPGRASRAPNYQVGRRIPLPRADPRWKYTEFGYDHLVRAERWTHVWLEQEGIEFDVISDFDLHSETDILASTQVLVLAGHAEYWSVEMFRALDRWLIAGGKLVSLTANAIWWRVGYDATSTLLECRKVDELLGGQAPLSKRGESWHSHDGQRGGLLRDCGYPAQRLLGLMFLGYNFSTIAEAYTPYEVERAEHFLFNTPNSTGLRNGDPLGFDPQGGDAHAVGHEYDVTIATLNPLGTPPPGHYPPFPDPDIVRLATSRAAEACAFDYFGAIVPAKGQGAEMIYWQRSSGGTVFNAGSIGAGWVLAVDPAFANLLRNVFAHFGVDGG